MVKNLPARTFLVVQWLKLHAPNGGDPCSIRGQGTRSHMLQLNILYAASKMPLVTIKIWHTQISKKKKKNPPANAGDTGSIPGLGETKPQCHNYWVCTLEPGSHNY